MGNSNFENSKICLYLQNKSENRYFTHIKNPKTDILRTLEMNTKTVWNDI